MGSIQDSTVVDRRSSFEGSCETAHRRESGDTETGATVFDHRGSAPNYIRGSLSELCNIHCSHQWEASQAYNRRPGVVKDTVDAQCSSNVFTRKVRENAHRTKRRAITEASPAKEKTTASSKPAQNSIRRVLPSDHASEHGAEDAADGVTGIDGQRHIRQSKCVYFERERKSDYTRGPIRIVSASDGIDNSCAALLLNLNLSDSIKKAIEAQRKLVEDIRETQEQGEATRVSLKSLDEKLDYYHHRQVELVRGATAVSSEGFAALEKQLPEISRKIGDLENLRREKAADEPHRQFHLQACYKDSFETQRVVNCYLESAFVHAGLMSASVERETDTPTSSGQFDAVHSMVSVPTGGSSLHCCAEAATSQNLPPQRSVSVETEPVITLPEDIAALDLYRDYVRAKHRLNRAQWEFDLRDETREHEQYWNDRDLRRSGGTEGLPQEQFDLLWVEHISKLTRALIDAEEAFKTARTAAVSGGCQLEDPDASSVFEDDDDEGYPPSREAILKANAPKGMIEGWRKSVADKSGYPDTSAASAELDSRDGDEADLWGSWSVAADPPRQGKIRQWEKACTVADKKPVI